jgi:hypothetical protein
VTHVAAGSTAFNAADFTYAAKEAALVGDALKARTLSISRWVCLISGAVGVDPVEVSEMKLIALGNVFAYDQYGAQVIENYISMVCAADCPMTLALADLPDQISSVLANPEVVGTVELLTKEEAGSRLQAMRAERDRKMVEERAQRTNNNYTASLTYNRGSTVANLQAQITAARGGS